MIFPRGRGHLGYAANTAKKPRAHPALTKLRRLSAAFPETAEVEAWGHPTFRAGKKIFATFGEHQGEATIGVKQTRADQGHRVQEDGFFVPPYVGQHGWVGICVDRIDWSMVTALVEQSYRLVALKRMIKALDSDETR